MLDAILFGSGQRLITPCFQKLHVYCDALFRNLSGSFHPLSNLLASPPDHLRCPLKSDFPFRLTERLNRPLPSSYRKRAISQKSKCLELPSPPLSPSPRRVPREKIDSPRPSEPLTRGRRWPPNHCEGLLSPSSSLLLALPPATGTLTDMKKHRPFPRPSSSFDDFPPISIEFLTAARALFLADPYLFSLLESTSLI